MEDEHVVIDKFHGDSTQGFFAVYDGHGGTDAVKFVAANLHKVKFLLYKFLLNF